MQFADNLDLFMLFMYGIYIYGNSNMKNDQRDDEISIYSGANWLILLSLI